MNIITTQEQGETLKDAVRVFGLDNQIKMLLEELGELVVAASHYSRGREGSFDNFVEELADVAIMLKQMIYALDCEVPFRLMCEAKINRLQERVDDVQRRHNV